MVIMDIFEGDVFFVIELICVFENIFVKFVMLFGFDFFGEWGVCICMVVIESWDGILLLIFFFECGGGYDQ